MTKKIRKAVFPAAGLGPRDDVAGVQLGKSVAGLFVAWGQKDGSLLVAAEGRTPLLLRRAIALAGTPAERDRVLRLKAARG